MCCRNCKLSKLEYGPYLEGTDLEDDPLSYSLISYNQLGNLCQGDSGGPAFTSLKRGQYVLLGEFFQDHISYFPSSILLQV